MKNIDYIESTFHPSTRASFDRESNARWAEAARFEGLRILKSSEKDDEGFVEFEARFRMDGKAHVHREASTFRRENGIWYFVEGVVS